jgi:deoxyribodipyrimidine photo-lyase
MRTLVWFRVGDLRISDHAPLHSAVGRGDVIPLFVLEPHLFAPVRARRAPHRMQFWLDSLHGLAAGLKERGSRLVVLEGRSLEVIPRSVRRWQADRVVAHRRVDPVEVEDDRRLKAVLGARFELFEGQTLHPPGTLRTNAGRPYSVFTQFSRTFHREASIGPSLPSPRALPRIPRAVTAHATRLPTCEGLGITRNPAVLAGGELAARKRLRGFLRNRAAAYSTDRDRMDREGTSRLSADLVAGTISVRQVWNEVERTVGDTVSGRAFRNELVWREFTHSTLCDRPEVLSQPFRPRFVGFPWREDAAAWNAWVVGQTGYPVVDASARQLLGEGFVHNRARMISASFLTKHLLIDYRRGEAHYFAYLTDGDPAQNNAGWQWSAGSGCDAQPHYRMFSPVLQGAKFDPDGNYVRRWVPELTRIPARYIHRPWDAPASVLRSAGVRLGVDYPHPIVEHAFARSRFLALAAEHLDRSRSSCST